MALHCIIMAAGTSSRFGSCKLLAPYHGIPLVEHSIKAALHTTANSITLVVGAYENALKEALAENYINNKRINCIANKNWQAGLGGSIAYAASRLPATDSILIMLADQVHISTTDIAKIITLSQQHTDKIICSEYANQLGVPAIFPAQDHRALCALSGEQGAKAIINAASDHRLSIPFQHAAYDVDTTEDLAYAERGPKR